MAGGAPGSGAVAGAGEGVDGVPAGREADPGRPAAPVFAVIAGGGTGGHVVPGLALARALARRGHLVHWVGSRRGIESRVVPPEGFGLTVLAGQGFERRLSTANARAAWQLSASVARATQILGELRPRVVVALGGWASVPCSLAAAARRTPVVVMEQNAVPGAANRLVGRLAAAAAVSFPTTALPRAVVTGSPVRREIATAERTPGSRARARAALGVPEGRLLVGVSGGSLGALRLNRAVVDALPAWAGRADLAVHHVVGERDWDLIAGDRVPASGELHYRPVRYEQRMDLVLTAADLMVQRAGGSTVAELAAVGVPSILVPLPNAPGDHQTANARVLVDAGGAVLVPDAELDAGRLVAEVDALLGDPARLEAMAGAAAGLGRPGAAEAVADLVERHARRA